MVGADISVIRGKGDNSLFASVWGKISSAVKCIKIAASKEV